MKAIDETERRRKIQQTYNEMHGIVPMAAGKEASNLIVSFLELSRKLKQDGSDAGLALEAANLRDRVKQLRQKMAGSS